MQQFKNNFYKHFELDRVGDVLEHVKLVIIYLVNVNVNNK